MAERTNAPAQMLMTESPLDVTTPEPAEAASVDASLPADPPAVAEAPAAVAEAPAAVAEAPAAVAPDLPAPDPEPAATPVASPDDAPSELAGSDVQPVPAELPPASGAEGDVAPAAAPAKRKSVEAPPLTLAQIKRLQTGRVVTKRKKPKSNPADRHRGVFFARLNELRRAERPGAESPSAADASELPEAEVLVVTDGAAGEGSIVQEVVAEAGHDGTTVGATEPTSPAPTDEGVVPPDAPTEAAVAAAESAPVEPLAEPSVTAAEADTGQSSAAEQDPAPAPATPGPATPVKRTPPAPLTGTGAAKVQVAITRVGGPDVIRSALTPQDDGKGQPMKWAAVCAERSQGLAPGDPTFQAWLRLAATPVRDIKTQVRALTPAEERGGRGGERSGGRGGDRSGGAQGGRGGRDSGGFRDRGPRSDRGPSGSEIRALARDGGISAKVRIVTNDNEDRRKRDAERKAAKEAKRQAERDRLARLGY